MSIVNSIRELQAVVIWVYIESIWQIILRKVVVEVLLQ